MGTSGTMARGDGVPQARQSTLGARALREWITGRPGEYARVILVESGVAVDALVDLVDRDDVILLPEGTAYDGSGRVIHYGGALSEAGDEFFLGQRAVELQDYVAAAFVQILGPTVVRFFDGSSWETFLDDAELARRTGIFPSPLIDPRVLLADRGAIQDPRESTMPSALRVSADGALRIGLQGDAIGGIGDLPDLLTRPLPRVAALGAVEPGRDIVADLAGRDWIARYLAAADLMKMLRLTNGEVRIAGFGWSLLDDGLADAEAPTADPFLLDAAEGFVLADTTTLRRQLLPPLTAGVVAAMQTSSTPERAAERIGRRFETSTAHARDLCQEATTALGVHIGGSRTGSPRT